MLHQVFTVMFTPKSILNGRRPVRGCNLTSLRNNYAYNCNRQVYIPNFSDMLMLHVATFYERADTAACEDCLDSP